MIEDISGWADEIVDIVVTDTYREKCYLNDNDLQDVKFDTVSKQLVTKELDGTWRMVSSHVASVYPGERICRFMDWVEEQMRYELNIEDIIDNHQNVAEAYEHLQTEIAIARLRQKA